MRVNISQGAELAAAVEDMPRRGQFRLFVEAFFQNKLSIIGLIIIIGAVAVALAADVIAPYDPNAQNILTARFQPPSAAYICGTDQYGRDVLSRIIHGARISLLVGVVSITLATICGVLLGGVAGYAGGRIDDAIMRVMDIFLAFPGLILAIGILAVLGPSVFNVIAVIAVVSIPQVARVTRSAVLTQKEEEYVQAARVIGQPGYQRLFKHILLNCLAPITVQSTLLVAWAILTETSLSFLGLGVRPPNRNLGVDPL